MGTVRPGFAITLPVSAASLSMPPDAFPGPAVVALFQSGQGQSPASEPAGSAFKPAPDGPAPVSEAYSVVMSSLPLRAGEIRFDVGDLDRERVPKLAVYRREGDEWTYAGGQDADIDGRRTVSAPVGQAGIYRLMVPAYLGEGSGAGPARPVAPRAYRLGQNYPNPFNPSTSIPLSIPETGAVALRVYDLTGRTIRTLVEGAVPAGTFVLTWDGRDELGRAVASGVYFYRLEAPGAVIIKKMMLLK